jgi:hypothetical protein
MTRTDTNVLQEPPGPVESPRCVNCHTAMRHSCTEDMETGGERRTYECVKCTSTQSIETLAA